MSAVLVVRPSSLGDLVYAMALVADLRAHRPDLAVDWVAEESFAPVVAMNKNIRRVIPVALRRWRARMHRPSTWREFREFRRALRGERYLAILDLQEQVKGAILARIARGVRHGLDRANIREPIATLLHDAHHAIDKRQHFVVRSRALAAAALGYTLDHAPSFGLAAPPPSAADIAPPGRYLVFFHATSRREKLWPEAHWRALARHLTNAGYAVLLPWGTDDEHARSKRIAEGIAGAIVPPRQPLTALASVIARACGVVGVDTGLVHLAAALGTPTIALFTATDPALAGVAVAGAHACDLGAEGRVPAPEAVADRLDEQMARDAAR